MAEFPEYRVRPLLRHQSWTIQAHAVVLVLLWRLTKAWPCITRYCSHASRDTATLASDLLGIASRLKFMRTWPRTSANCCTHSSARTTITHSRASCRIPSGKAPWPHEHWTRLQFVRALLARVLFTHLVGALHSPCWCVATCNLWVQAYDCPTYFRDDWLNDFLTSTADAHVTATASKPAQRAAQSIGERQSSCKHSQDLPFTPEALQEAQSCCRACTGAENSGPTEARSSEAHVSDYRFVYMGLQGSRTLVHADVLRSFSWSINIAGKKRCVSTTSGLEARACGCHSPIALPSGVNGCSQCTFQLTSWLEGMPVF
jgi:hypothetical protein